jgi:hypothetical protein
MATTETLIPIPGRLHSVASEGHVAGADEIYDDTSSMLQSAINASVSGNITTLQSDKADKSATVSTVTYTGSTRKLQKTINGTTTNVFTADNAPTSGSNNPITSDAVYTALKSIPTYVSATKSIKLY